MAQSESETVLTEHHETDNLDPRTDAPARPGTPVHIAPVQLGNITVPTPVVLSPMAGGAQGHSSRRWFGLALENRHFH